MEQHLGRELTSEEVVHHIKNLQLLSSKSEHRKLHPNPNAKLTDADALEIKLKKGKIKGKVLAEQYGVSPNVVSRIWMGIGGNI